MLLYHVRLCKLESISGCNAQLSQIISELRICVRTITIQEVHALSNKYFWAIKNWDGSDRKSRTTQIIVTREAYISREHYLCYNLIIKEEKKNDKI